MDDRLWLDMHLLWKIQKKKIDIPAPFSDMVASVTGALVSL